jgi:hypothetical protein
MTVSPDGFIKGATITDTKSIHAATTFIQNYQDGWREDLNPRASLLIFEFYRGDGQHLGGFGIADTYITRGPLDRDVPAEEIRSLASKLRLEWPPR